MQQPSISGFQQEALIATLLTASATTGWMDWIHGEAMWRANVNSRMRMNRILRPAKQDQKTGG